MPTLCRDPLWRPLRSAKYEIAPHCSKRVNYGLKRHCKQYECAIKNDSAKKQSVPGICRSEVVIADSRVITQLEPTKPSEIRQYSAASIEALSKLSTHALSLCFQRATSLVKTQSFRRNGAKQGCDLTMRSPLIQKLIFLYAEHFYRGRSNFHVDMTFLRSIAHIDEKGACIGLSRDLLTRCVFQQNVGHKRGDRSILPLQSSQIRDFHVYQLAEIICILSTNLLLCDQNVLLLLCNTLEVKVHEILHQSHKRKAIFTWTTFTASQALACVSALAKMKVYHTVLKSLLNYMASMPPRSRLGSTSISSLNVDKLTEALVYLNDAPELVTESDFLQFLRRIFLEIEYISPQSVSHLISLMADRQVHKAQHPRYVTSEQSVLESGQKSGKKVECSFSLNKGSAGPVDEILQIIDDTVLKRLPEMSVFDICRVMRAMAADLVGVGSAELWKALLRQIYILCQGKHTALIQSSPEQGLGNELVPRQKRCKKQHVPQRRNLLDAYATILVILPKLELRLRPLAEGEVDVFCNDEHLLKLVASNIPTNILQSRPNYYKGIISKLRRAYSDYPELYEINAELWEVVKLARVPVHGKPKRKHYRTPIASKGGARRRG